MRCSRHAIRAFVTAVSLLLCALLAADSAAAQVVPVAERGVVSVQDTSVSPHEEHEPMPADCQSHRGGRNNPVNSPAPAANPLHMCVCHAGPVLGPKHVAPVTGSEAHSRGRTVELPVLHQVFRC